MLVHVYMIKEGDEIITPTWIHGQVVKDVEVFEEDTVKITYVTGSIEWFTKNQIVVRRGND